ncbi:FlgB family protein [Primorskyibacter flagellatus]|uniref:Flagellar basal body rod protein FlgB n=1 Tax=Primorskyibacter flagellatus TaxID=1387277 RepID=A0A1W2A9N9_9RHOB|nr:FlgB family protein [Primorskyibacter flagellatus]SMC56968.1 flagellar basal-body rod protein FlgB [Primorskyibacter flagellatus]
MYQNLEIFRTAISLAQHAGTRQAVISQNIANADTPDYLARQVGDFASFANQTGGVPKATRAGHLNGNISPATPEISVKEGASDSPNGNGVSVEMEMVKAVEAKRNHDQALAVYKSSLNILRASLGRG